MTLALASRRIALTPPWVISQFWRRVRFDFIPFGGNYQLPASGFTIGTAGSIDFGIFPPDAVHIFSGSFM